jgi:HNH endonuclease
MELSELPEIEQLLLKLEASSDSESPRQNDKPEQIEKITGLSKQPLNQFGNLVRRIVGAEDGYQFTTLLEILSDKELSRKERLKIQICYLLNREKSMTMAQLYKSLGASIQGKSAIKISENCIVWDNICPDGVDALNELEGEEWIKSYEITSIEFIEKTKCSNSLFENLPSVLPGKSSEKVFQNPHWLPIEFEPGLRLIAIDFHGISGNQKNSREDDLIQGLDLLEVDRFLKPEEIDDERKRVLQYIVQRQGQKTFRTDLLDAYQNQCAITGCGVIEVLEAAHIIPYLGVKTNHVSNGLILRADLHTLFDLFLFTIDPESLTVIISPSLKNTYYENISGENIRQRKSGFSDVSKAAIQYHFSQCSWIQGF